MAEVVPNTLKVDEPIAFWLMSLFDSGALTLEQARRLIDGWFELDADTWHQPWFRTVGAHERAYVGDFPKAAT